MTTNAARLRPGDPCAFVVFGAMGDLTKRKLLPALHNLRANGLLPRDFAFIGVARRPLDDRTYREYAAAATGETGSGKEDDDFSSRVHYVKGDFEDPATYEALSAALARAARDHGTSGNAIFYLATPEVPWSRAARASAAASASYVAGSSKSPFT